MIDHGIPMKEIRRDILRWPGARSIRDGYELDVFTPTTLAIVAGWLKAVPRARALIALAQTADWTRAAADELVDLVDDWRARMNDGLGEWEKDAHIKAMFARNAKKSSASRRKKEVEKGLLPVLQGLVQEGRAIHGPCVAPLVIANWINGLDVNELDIQSVDRAKLSKFKVENATSSSVGKAIRALRKKGL